MADAVPRRVVVRGSSGSGKTTLARRLAALLDVPHVELDAIHHQPGWTPLPREPFRAAVDEALPADGGWVVDGNYDQLVGDIPLGRADALVWLDLPRWRVVRRLAWRTLRRTLTREELWNGNREHWSNLTSLDPERNLVVWSWTHHDAYRDRLAAIRVDPALADLTIHHVRTDADARALVESLRRAVGTG